MKKKLTVLLLILVLVFSFTCLTACADYSTETTTLTLWHYYNNEQLLAFNRLVDEFNETVGKEKRIIIKHSSPGYVNDVAQKIIAAATGVPGADAMPNIFMTYADTAYIVDQLGLLAELDAYFKKEELSDYVDRYLDEGRFDGEHLKIFPIAKSTEILMLNKTDWDKFAAVHPDVSLSELSTVEGILRVSELYYEWSGKAFYSRDSLSNYFIVGSKSLGKDLMYRDADGNFKVDFDETVLRHLWEGFYVPFVKGHFYSSSSFRSTDVSTGNILAYTGSTSSSPFFPKSVQTGDDTMYPIEHYTLPAPKFEEGADIAVQQGAGLAVTKSDAKTEEACAVFLKWFTEVENNERFSIESSYMPVRKSAVISDYLEKSENLDPRVYDALKVSEKICADNDLYSNIPSEYSNSVRSVLDKHIENYSKAKRQEYLNLISDEMSREEKEKALEPFIGDAAFAAWLKDFTDKITAVYQTA